MATDVRVLNVVELFSGIGGMRYALQESKISHTIAAAVDLNNMVNGIYRHNFGSVNHMQRNIMSLTAEEIDSLKADMVTLSPPCQPFTRVGLKLDTEDPRSLPFLHFLKILPNLKCKPSYMFLENVVGFEKSQVRDQFLAVLNECDYSYQEFLVSPVQFGIPNSRTRYYILAKLKPTKFVFSPTGLIERNWPTSDILIQPKFHCEACTTDELKNCKLSHFLEKEPESYFQDFLVPDKVLEKNVFVFDIVEETSSNSCCFTKGYSHYAKGTGSVLHPSTASKVTEVFEDVKLHPCNEHLKILKTLRLRYFTPREIANLMCFPQNFSFPEHVSARQRNQALGNSINVFVVSCFLKLLISDITRD